MPAFDGEYPSVVGLKIIQIVDSVTIKHTNDLLGELVRFHPNDNPPGNSYLHEWRHHVSVSEN